MSVFPLPRQFTRTREQVRHGRRVVIGQLDSDTGTALVRRPDPEQAEATALVRALSDQLVQAEVALARAEAERDGAWLKGIMLGVVIGVVLVLLFEHFERHASAD
jgi:hypothetical protein